MRKLIWVLVAGLLVACSPQDGTTCTNCKGWCEMNPHRVEGPEYAYPKDGVLCVCDCDGLEAGE